MPLTRDQLQAKQDEITDRGKIDGIDATNAVLVICDTFGESPVAVMTRIRDLRDHSPQTIMQLPTAARIIFDLLEISQSNFKRAVSDITDLVEVSLALEEMDNSDT